MLDIFSTNVQDLSLGTVVLNLALAFVLSLMIAFVYQKTHKGLSYSQTYVVSLVILGILSSVIMMVIGTAVVRAVALLGAFTIIRFRTAVKDTRDITFILFSLITGMAVGVNNYPVAVVSAVLISLIVFLLDKINFGSINRYDYILTFSLDKEKTSSDVYESVFRQYLKKYDLLNINTRNGGQVIDLTFNLRVLLNVDLNKLVADLISITGIEKVNLIMAKNDIEY